MYKVTGYQLAFAGLAIFFAGAAALAEDPVLVRATIQRTEDDNYVVKSRSGRELRLKLAANAAVAVSVNTALWDIKEGSYVGVVGMPQPDGSHRAIEVHIFHETLRGLAEGHRSWDLQPQATMTYGTAWQLASTEDGHSVTLYYMDGEKWIVIPVGTPTFTYLPGRVAELEPGATIFVASAAMRPDGPLEAHYVMVGRHDAPAQ